MLQWNDVLNYARNGNPEPDRKVQKTDDEWRQVLSLEAFAVTRQTGTERAFSSEMCSLFKPGTYKCACCETVLFDAEGKFEIRYVPEEGKWKVHLEGNFGGRYIEHKPEATVESGAADVKIEVKP